MAFRLFDTAGVDNDVMAMTAEATGKAKRNGGGHKRRKRIAAEDLTEENMAKEEVVLKGMARQTLEAARESDVVLLMFDGRAVLQGGSPVEVSETARWLRRNLGKGGNKRIVLLANKLEGDRWGAAEVDAQEAFLETERLGFGEPLLVSAEHGDGMAEIAALLGEATVEKYERMRIEGTLPSPPEIELGDGAPGALRPVTLAILGRQNVGKSTLLNALVEDDRVITGSMAGLTRDAIAVDFERIPIDGDSGRTFSIVDTAGIRKEGKRDNTNVIEGDSVRDAMRALKVAHVCLLVVDADGGHLTKTELGIADAVIKEGRALVVVANKADKLVSEYGISPMKYAADVKNQVDTFLPHVGDVMVVPTSSLIGDGVSNVLPTVERVFERWNTRINTGALNSWFKEVVVAHPPPMVRGRATRMKCEWGDMREREDAS